MPQRRNDPAGLPELDAESALHMQSVQAYIADQIRQSADHYLPFDAWMNHALYAPGLGYYVAGSAKLASADQPAGDFTTAPELSALFGQAMAGQAAQIMAAAKSFRLLEFGAGSGALAASLIPALRLLGIEPRYQILEPSPELRQRQHAALAHLKARITWIDAPPAVFDGCVLANEVLDAMPVNLFRWSEDGQVMELGVTLSDDSQAPFRMTERPAPERLRDAVTQRMPALPGYQSEINLRAEAWVRDLGNWLRKGAALLIDYGFPRHEYYHPQRNEGTLMCHFRHHAHSQPLTHVGLQDITAHLDFTALADAAVAGGLSVLGYTSQARFLINAGLIELLTQLDPANVTDYAKAVGPVQRLISEAEMGELFKVLAVGKGLDVPLIGFARGDRRDRL